MLPSSWKRDIASGLVVLVPLLITAYVVAFIYRAIADLPILQVIESTELRVLVTLVLFVLLVLSFGYLMRTTIGDLFEEFLDNVMNRLPGLRMVYNASKMAIETALTGTEELQKPVKLEVWDGMRMTAFKTGKTTQDGREVLFIPTAPNITTGYVVEVESDRYVDIDERVEEALTRILSAGFGESGNSHIPIDTIDEEYEDEPEPDHDPDPQPGTVSDS
ncbi:MAG: DUF502 domain-containing protein [Natronomonas sp.]